MNDRVDAFKTFLSEQAADRPGTSIGSLLRLLRQEEADLLELCAIPHVFNPRILRVLAPQLSRQRAEECFRAFSDLAVTISIGSNLALHDKVRQFHFQRWLQPEKRSEFAAASRRLVDFLDLRLEETYYTPFHSAIEIARIYHLLGADQEAGFAEFERLFRSRRQKYALNDCRTLVDRTGEYRPILTDRQRFWLSYHDAKLMLDGHNLEEASEIFQSLLREQEKLPASLRIRVNLRLGMVYNRLRDWDSAILRLQKAQGEAQQSAEDFPSHRLTQDLAVTHRDKGELKEAKLLFEKAIAEARQKDAHFDLAVNYNGLGILYWKAGEAMKAEEAYKESLKYLEQLEDSFRPAQVDNNLGILHRDQRNWEESEKYFRESIAIKERAGDAVGKARSQKSLVSVLQAQEKTEEAVTPCAQAARTFEGVRDWANAAETLRQLARLHKALGDREGMTAAYNKSIRCFRRCDPSRMTSTEREMEEAVEELKAETVPSKPVIWRLLRLFYAPRQTFEEVRMRPKWALEVLIVSILAGLTYTVHVFTNGPEEYAQDFGEVSTGEGLVLYFLFVLVKALSWILLVGLLLYFSYFVIGGGARWRHYLSVTLHAAAAYHAIDLLVAGANALIGSDTYHPNPSFLVDKGEEPFVHAFLQMHSLGTIYFLFLLAIGLSVVTRRRTLQAAAIIVTTNWLLLAVIWASLDGW